MSLDDETLNGITEIIYPNTFECTAETGVNREEFVISSPLPYSVRIVQ